MKTPKVYSFDSVASFLKITPAKFNWLIQKKELMPPRVIIGGKTKYYFDSDVPNLKKELKKSRGG